MTVSRDIYSGLSVAQILVPAVINTDTNTASVDTRGFDSAGIIIHIGNSADTLNGSNTIEVEIEDSPDDSAWTDVTDAQITNAVTGTNTGTVAVINAAAEDVLDLWVGYRGDQRYIRAVINFTGTHATGTPIGATGVRGHAHINPVNAVDDL